MAWVLLYILTKAITPMGEIAVQKHQQRFGGADGTGRFRAAPFLFALVLCCALSAGGLSFGEGLSLQAVKMPLENVLRDLSQKTGVAFVYDKAWADLSITAQFKNMALEPALKRILSNLNHAIIYSTDGTVIIRIYGTIAYEKGSSMGSERVGSYAEQSASDRFEEMNPQDDADMAGSGTDENPEESAAASPKVPEEAETVEESPGAVEAAEEVPDSDETEEEAQTPPADEEREEEE